MYVFAYRTSSQRMVKTENGFAVPRTTTSQLAAGWVPRSPLDGGHVDGCHVHDCTIAVPRRFGAGKCSQIGGRGRNRPRRASTGPLFRLDLDRIPARVGHVIGGDERLMPFTGNLTGRFVSHSADEWLRATPCAETARDRATDPDPHALPSTHDGMPAPVVRATHVLQPMRMASSRVHGSCRAGRRDCCQRLLRPDGPLGDCVPDIRWRVGIRNSVRGQRSRTADLDRCELPPRVPSGPEGSRGSSCRNGTLRSSSVETILGDPST